MAKEMVKEEAKEEARETVETRQEVKQEAAKMEKLGMQEILQAQALEGGMKPVSEEDRYRIVCGIQSVKKKDGSGYAYKLYFQEPYTTYDMQNGQCLGTRVSDEYIRDAALVPPTLAIGDRVKIYKEQRGNYLSVVEIRIL